MLFLLLLVSSLTLLYCYLKFYVYEYWNKRGVLGPKPSLIFGNIKDSFFFKKNQGEIYADIYKEFPNAPFVGIYKANSPAIIIRDPQLVQDVTVKSFSNFHDNDFYIDENKDPLFGRNPFVAAGATWKRHRTPLLSAFSNTKIRTMYNLIEESCVKFVSHIGHQSDAFNGNGLDAKALFSKFTLNNIASCAFGIDPKCYEDPNCEFIQLANGFLNPTGWSSLQLFLSTLIPALNKLFTIRFTPVSIQKRLTSLVKDVLKYREKNNVTRNDFMDMMKTLKTSETVGFTDVDITAHAAGFFVDGYETSSLVLSYIFYELAKHPEIQQRLREEILENYSGLSYDTMQKMEYLDAVFNESVRLHPPLFAFVRRCTKPYEYIPKAGEEIKKTVTIEPGTPTIIPVQALHHDENYFEDAESFRPGRFLGENKDKIAKYTFMPFGEGPRICLGMRFGLLQVKMGIIHVIKNFKVTLNRNKTQEPLKFDPIYFLVFPDGGIWLDFEKVT